MFRPLACLPYGHQSHFHTHYTTSFLYKTLFNLRESAWRLLAVIIIWLILVLLNRPVWTVSQETVYCTSLLCTSCCTLQDLKSVILCTFWTFVFSCYSLVSNITSLSTWHKKNVCSFYAWYIGYSTYCQRSHLTLIFLISPTKQKSMSCGGHF